MTAGSSSHDVHTHPLGWLACGDGDGGGARIGGGLRQTQEHRDKVHTGQLAPPREVVVPRPKDRAAGEGLGPLPAQDRAGGAGATVKAPAVSDVTGEGRRPPREQRLVRGARPPVTRVRIVPTREPEQGPREGVLPRARVARHRRQVPARRRSRGALRAGGSNLAGYAFDPEARFRLQPDLTCTFSVGGDGAPPTNYERRSGGTADATAFASTPSGAIG